jgi:D-alanyl-D-alanine carboxypeptidase/D-alanyl-D-alanine-endopeptidase (penicillin-binding protein 4)
MSRRTTLAVLATAAIVCGALAIRTLASPSGGRSSAAPRVPVLSLQRAPQLLSRLASDVRLSTALDAALADPTLGSAGDQGCLLVRDSGGRVVYARQPSRALVPASNLKLVTAFALLDRLGPTTRYRTEVVGPGVSAGVVSGDLYVVGSGDPILATADYAAVGGYQSQPRLATPLETLADRLVAAGVRQVQGRLLGDESRYDSQRYGPTWKAGYISDAESGPASALTVNSGFVAWKPKAVPAPAPATNAASVLAALLQARGVTVGGVGEGVAPAGLRPVATLESSPLTDVVAEMLQQSDNLAAELMLKELGKRFGAAGSTAAGLGVVRETLEKAGLPVGELTAYDGSGLDRADRTTCGLLVGILQRAGDRGPLAQALPVAARDGTLAKRFLTSPAAGRLRAKTGSLEGVIALSGWVDAEKGARLVFSMLINDLPREAVGRALEERMGTALARYPQGPDAAALAP